MYSEEFQDHVAAALRKQQQQAVRAAKASAAREGAGAVSRGGGGGRGGGAFSDSVSLRHESLAVRHESVAVPDESDSEGEDLNFDLQIEEEVGGMGELAKKGALPSGWPATGVDSV